MSNFAGNLRDNFVDKLKWRGTKRFVIAYRNQQKISTDIPTAIVNCVIKVEEGLIKERKGERKREGVVRKKKRNVEGINKKT